jgi:arylsulfatase A-like enzyme
MRFVLETVGMAVTVVAMSGMAVAKEQVKPNILFILADDLGYGDPACFNPQSKIRTPNMDRLAREGIRFMDAHAPGSTCIPSRYGLLTGRYPFRASHLVPSKGALIEAGRATIASVLRENGYATAMVGKWHLGFEGGDAFDGTKPLRGGPVDHGFDTFFGQHASLDIPPYFFIENDRCVNGGPTGLIEANNSPDWSPIQGAFWRKGGIAPGFKLEDVLSIYTRKTIEYLQQRGKASDGKPFFCYLALTAPHTPWLPTESFKGKSACGMYGDWVEQLDGAVGNVLDALDRAALTDNTLVIFTSDNGPVWYQENKEKFGHSAVGILRGMKGDAWEGGHRMPFMARWPGKIKAGSSSGETICFTDMLKTFATIVGAKLPSGAGEDSYNILPALLNEKYDPPLRGATVLGPSKKNLTIWHGGWKLIPFLGSGGFSKPSKVDPKPGEVAGQLYNLNDDIGETKNVFAEHPERVKALTELLEKIRAGQKSSQ